MKDVTEWSVRELKRYLQTQGVNTHSFKQKNDLIELASQLVYENERAEWLRNGVTFAVIALTVLFLNVFVRSRMEKLFWLNPKWALSWVVLNLIWLLEKLLTVNVLLSWILPSTLSEYNLIDTYVVKQFQLFPLSVPVNYDSQTQHASMWIDLYPMLLLYLLRKLKEHIGMYYHYAWYNQYRDTYYQRVGQLAPHRNSEIQGEPEESYEYDSNSDEYDVDGSEDDDNSDDESGELMDEALQRALLESMYDR